MINNLSFNLTKPIFGRSNKLLEGSENMYLSCFCILYQLSATLIISSSNYCIVIIWFGQVETENKPSKSVKMSHFGVVFSKFFWLRGGEPPRAPPLTYSAALHAALQSNLTHFMQFYSIQFAFRGHTATIGSHTSCDLIAKYIDSRWFIDSTQ